MKTVLNVKTDKDIKERAQALAKHLRIPLSTVVNAQLRAFVESGEFTVTREPTLRPSVIKELNRAITQVQAGTNMSPRFSTTAEAIEWLDT
jgi:antitoxin component of RelBE/YafQ-DinJ toxin-antitoxin module